MLKGGKKGLGLTTDKITHKPIVPHDDIKQVNGFPVYE